MPPRRQLRAATPREIRRAFGENALAVINDHAEHIESLTTMVGAHEALIHPEHGSICQNVKGIEAIQGDDTARISNLLTRVKLLEKEAHESAALRTRDLWGRLRYLFTGQ